MKISLLQRFLLVGLLAITSMAQDRVPDLQGLIGMRASSGQAELEYRGFAFVKSGGVGGEGRYSYYWSGARQLCITVATVNGRFDSIVTSPPFDCGRNANQGGSSSGSVVTVYEDHDLRGRSQVFHDGRYLNNRGQLGNLRNDRASSVDVPVGYSVRLCDGEGTGYGILPCQVFGPGRHNLPYTLDNRVSYVEVSQILWGGGTGTGPGAPVPSTPGLGRPGATVYSDRNFRGRSQSYGPGRYLNTERQLGDLRNDEASSVAVLNGYRVKLCENEGAYGHGGGRCEEYGPGRYNLRYNDDVSYVEVTRSSGGSANLPGWIGSILKVNVTDLVGERVVSGDTKMRNRGFRLVDTLRSGRAYYTIWWRGVSRQCIQVAVANNRYDSVSDIGSHERCY